MSNSTESRPVETIADLVDYLEGIAREDSTVVATTRVGTFSMEPEVEPEFEEIAAMIRLNGGILAYTRSSKDGRVHWNGLTIQASNLLTAWFFRELIKTDRSS